MSAVYSVREISGMLNLCEREVYAMLSSGVIPCLRWGRRYIVSRPEFDAWLERCSQSSKAVN